MTALRIVSLVLALTAVLTLGVGTLGFSDIAADRNVNVQTTSDENAYVSYEPADVDTEIRDGNTIDLVEIGNQFPDNKIINVTDVSISVDSNGITIDKQSLPETVGPPGEFAQIKGTVEECQLGESATVGVTVEVEGSSVAAEVFGDVGYREFTVECVDQADVVSPDNLNIYTEGSEGSNQSRSSRVVEFQLTTDRHVSSDEVSVSNVSVTDTAFEFSDKKSGATGLDVTLRSFDNKQFGAGEAAEIFEKDGRSSEVTVKITFSDGSMLTLGINSPASSSSGNGTQGNNPKGNN